MHSRVLKARPLIALALALFAFQGGMAAGPARPVGAADPAIGKFWAALGVMPATAAAPPVAPAEAAPAPEAPAAPVSPAEATLVPPERTALKPVLVQAAQEYGLPTDLVLAQAWAESSWRVTAVSHAQAQGVLQLTPDTVEFVSRRLLRLDQPLDPFDPAANARMGARFMRHILDRVGGDLRLALIAYNQGLTALLRNGPYAEAEAYADKVLALALQFAPA
jgi:soluble lytic murein transglycosylase-like protein